MSNRESKELALAAPKAVAATIPVTSRRRRQAQRGVTEIEPHAPVGRRTNLALRFAFVMAPIERLNRARRQLRRHDATQNARALAGIERFRICPSVAAEATGRVRRGIEIDAPYCDPAIRRREQVTDHDARLAVTAEIFGEVRAGRSNKHDAKSPRRRASDERR